MSFAEGDKVKLWRANSPGVEEYEGMTGVVMAKTGPVSYLVKFGGGWAGFRFWRRGIAVCFADELVSAGR